MCEVGAGWDPFPSQVEKVCFELTGNGLTALPNESPRARHAHARAHGLSVAWEAGMRQGVPLDVRRGG